MYYILYAFLYLVSLLPFWFLYGISYLAYVLIYYIIGYRKAVVFSNIAVAFPNKTEAERKRIAKSFYKNFTDNFMEVIKLFSISPAQLQNRMTWDYEFLDKYYRQGKNVQLHLGHFFNWEYANLSVSFASRFPVLVVYMPITGKAIDKVFIKLRTRFNAKMIRATSFLKDFKPYSKQQSCLVFVADQNAGSYNLAYWLSFFNKMAPFVTGPEKTARLNNSVCIYVNFKKVKRGYYHGALIEITDSPRQLQEGEITKRTRDLIEENMREQPENYLWTHRRWKRTFNPAKHRAL
ncbi:lysophospholipid acyltransferase family protein [Parafilimonas sp.]|uniref:lysophospholipid acyltransferase family protein n=1 Tax=Parafilimonas sp. TaxID=1969739 RepID=UPI0039E664D9